MANLNVAEWTPEQVAEWMSGLEPCVVKYAGMLRARGLDGRRLLLLTCDALEDLGMTVIGHQELLLEAVDQLRNFHYECRRECVLQLALRVSAAGGALRRLRAQERLETQALADVARFVSSVKPLACWLDRWPLCSIAPLAERKACLLKLALEAATCAQRDRFAEQPARQVAAAAAAAVAAADYIIQDVSEPGIVTPARLTSVSVRQGDKPLGFAVVPSACQYHQLAHIKFGSPAHASGALHAGDEIVQVCGVCVVGWSGAAVEARCGAGAGAGDDLALSVRRRAQRRPAPRRLSTHTDRITMPITVTMGVDPVPTTAEESDSDALSPPASPTAGEGGVPGGEGGEGARLYPPPPRLPARRRHSVCGASPVRGGHHVAIEQFWRVLKEQKLVAGGGSSNVNTQQPDDYALYRRDKAVSCSTGLCLPPAPRSPSPSPRGRLDKSHSTPAYDLQPPSPPNNPPQDDPIPESPTTPNEPADKADQILDFKKSSSAIGEAIQQRTRRLTDSEGEGPPAPILEAINPLIAPPPPSRRPAPLSPARDFPTLKIVPRQPDTPEKEARLALKGHRGGCSKQLSKQDIQLLAPAPPLPALNHDPSPAPASASAPAPHPSTPTSPASLPANTGGGGGGGGGGGARNIFPSAKTRSLKKKNSLLAKRRCVPWRVVCGRGYGGAVWQRVRGRGAGGEGRARWARRHLLLAHDTLYAYREPECARADCMIQLAGFTVVAAGEVKSRPFAFKVYHTGTAFYFAADSRDAMLAWIHIIHRATLAQPKADVSKQFSETDYSETESDDNSERKCEREKEREREREREKEKGKFGSLRKLTSRMTRAESSETVAGAASLDRKYLRIFSRHRHKDEHKHKGAVLALPTQQYRSYRRAPPPPPAPPAHTPAPATPGTPKPDFKLKALKYTHASNPNLAGAGDWSTGGSGGRRQDNFLGFVTLEEFMLKKQEEDRRQVYSNRVLMGVERGTHDEREESDEAARAARSLQRQLQRIVPDVIYGHHPPPPPPPARALPPPPHRPATGPKPISVKGKDGYEKIVYPEEMSSPVTPATPPTPAPAVPLDRSRGSFKKNDKVQPEVPAGSPPGPATSPEHTPTSGSVSRLRLVFGKDSGVTSPTQESPGRVGTAPPPPRRPHYPHLQCPPTFQPETYCLANLTHQHH